jgi:hypothetical protein
VRINWRFTDPDEDISCPPPPQPHPAVLTEKCLKLQAAARNGTTANGASEVRGPGRDWFAPALVGDFIPYLVEKDGGRRSSSPCFGRRRSTLSDWAAGFYFRRPPSPAMITR